MPSRRSPTPPHPRGDAVGAARPFDAEVADRQRFPGGIAHETGELHRLLVESVQDYAIFALNPAGYILSWNAGAERFKGYTADEITGKHFSIFYPPEKVAQRFPEFELREAARTGRFEDEGWRIRKDGSRFWANVVITALRDTSGTLVGYAKVTRDLSERRAAEDALRVSEERFRLLVQSVKDYAIFMLDPNGNVATWNEGAQRIKGYTADEIIGKHFSVFYPPDKVAERFPAHELEVAARVGQFEDEGWRVRKDGSRFWASVLITAVRNEDGVLVGFSKVTRDLTERRAAEEQAIENARRVAAEEAARLEADRARNRAERLQVLTAGLAATHTIGEVTHVLLHESLPVLQMDAAVLALTDAGDDRVAIVGHSDHLSSLPYGALRLEPDSPIGATMADGQIVVCRSRAERDARFPAVAQSLADYAVTVALPLFNGMRRLGALALHRREPTLSLDDMRLLQAFAQLCAQAVERAQLYDAAQLARQQAEESRAQAEEARRRADEANRAKSEFLAAMSHELRTPLNAIAGYTELLELEISGPVTVQQREQLQRIRRSQRHLLGIINDLLNFSRIEAGQVEYTFDSVDLAAVLESVSHMITPQAEAAGIEFVLSSCQPNTTVWVDRAKTEQILLNLLSNAVKFTAAGGTVTLACERVDTQQLDLTVRDTGIGIPLDQQSRIFEPFVQVGRSLTSTREGTGLGLAISRDLARAMGGDISVRSTPDAGSVFTLTLPTSASAEHERRS